MKRERVVVIEDEPDILEVIHYNLSREGFEVVGVRDGDEGIEAVRTTNPELVVLDLMLPGTDGLEICRKLKTDPVYRSVPIVMVTAKGEESDIVLGLGLGADDYVTKPFSPKELIARIKAVLRRGPLKEDAASGERVVRNGLVIDAARHEVLIDAQAIELTATQFRLLHFLASHPGRVFARDQLVSRVIGENAVVIDRNIDVHVRALRMKLGKYRHLLETVRGVGYRFSGD
jgi:two-component system phosphate regulon response regulator PhoB